jgi:hypothetical protein
MTHSGWKSACAAVSGQVSLQDLDDELERITSLSEDERSALWLFAWASRDTVARVAELTA